MSIWSRLFGTSSPAPAAARPAAEHALDDLFRTPRPSRDPRWIARFHAAVPDAPLMAIAPKAQQGPDGFPYRQFDLSPGRGGQATTLRASLDSILDAGEGAVVFGRDTAAPEWVFTFGELLAFDLYGNFEGALEDEPSDGGNSKVTVQAKTEMLIGAPSEAYFPARARKALGAYLLQRIAAGSRWRPGIAVVVLPMLRPQRNLMLNFGIQEMRGDEEALAAEMTFVRWFLPPRHGLLARTGDIENSAFLPIGL